MMKMRSLWAVLAFGLITLSACSGPIKIMRRGVSAGAMGLNVLDGPASDGYDEAAARALAETDTREAYELAMEPWNELEDGMRASHSAFFAADAALDSAVAGGDDDWLQAGACAIVSARRLVSLGVAVGLDIPSDLTSSIEMISAIATAACRRDRRP